MTSLTMGELFAGIGGFSVGFHRAGFETRWAVEWDRDCRRVLRHHWPELELHGDICEVDPARLEHVDVITFGSPCQDLSVAGRRAGLGGARSGLFYEACRIIAGVRPEFAVWENVPGALSSNRGRDFGAVLDALADLGALDIGWRVLDAQWFGVAQRRRRVFVVADFGGFRASEILALADGLSGHPPPRRETGAGVAQSIRASTGSRGTDVPDRLTYVPVRAHALACHAAKGGDPTTDNYIAHTLTANGADASEDGTGRGTPLVVAADLAQVTSKGNYSNPKPGDPCHPLTSAANQSIVAHTLSSNGADASEDGTGRGTPLVAFTNRGIDTIAAETLRSGSHGALPMVAFSSKDYGNDAGDVAVAGALPAQPGMKQQNYVAMFEPGSIARDAGPSDLSLISSTLRADMGDNQPAILYNPLQHQGIKQGVEHGQEGETHAGTVLRILRESVGTQAGEGRRSGIVAPLRQAEILRPGMHGEGVRSTRRSESDRLVWGTRTSASDCASRPVFDVWLTERIGRASQEWDLDGQFSRELGAHLSLLPQQDSSAAESLHDLWETAEGLGVLRQALSAIQEVWRSADVQAQPAHDSGEAQGLTPTHNSRKEAGGFAVRRLTPL